MRLPGLRQPCPPARRSTSGPAAYAPGNSVSGFETIDKIAQLGWLTRPHRLCLAPAIAGRRPLPLFAEAALPEEVVRRHYDPSPPPPVFVYGLPGHELGGGGLLVRAGQVFRTADAIPEYFNGALRPDGADLPELWGGALFDPAATILEVDVPLAVPFHPNIVYGHFLLEMLPRLNILWRLRQAGAAFAVAATSSAPDWAKRILALYFDPDQIIWYDLRTERVRAPCFILPSMMHSNYRFHPAFNLDIDALKAALLPAPAPAPAPAPGRRRVWLSRARHPGLHGMVNEAEVEAAVAALGFEVVHPEDLGFVEQIALMDAAAIVAGAYSSAIHNSLFARLGTKVFCVNWVNWYQSGVSTLRAQPLAYLPGSDGQFRDWRVQSTAQARYTVDCAALREALQRFEAGQAF